VTLAESQMKSAYFCETAGLKLLHHA
jgi:hypothetical protein